MSKKTIKKVVMFYINNDANEFTNQETLKSTLDTINLLYGADTNKSEVGYYVQFDSPLFFDEDVVQENATVSAEDIMAHKEIKMKYEKWNGCIRFKVKGKTINEDIRNAKKFGYLGAVDMATPENFKIFLEYCKSDAERNFSKTYNIDYSLFMFGHGNGSEMIENKENYVEANNEKLSPFTHEVVGRSLNSRVEPIGSGKNTKSEMKGFMRSNSKRRFMNYSTSVDFLSVYLKPNTYKKPPKFNKPSIKFKSETSFSENTDAHRLLTITNLSSTIKRVFGHQKLELLCLEGCLLLNIENLYTLKESCAAVIGSPSYVYYKGFNIGRIGSIAANKFTAKAIFDQLSDFSFLNSIDDKDYLGDYKITLVTLGKAFDALCNEIFSAIVSVKASRLKQFNSSEEEKVQNNKRACKLSFDYFQFADLGECLSIKPKSIKSCVITKDSFSPKRDNVFNIANQYCCPSGVSIFMPYLGDRLSEMKTVTQEIEKRFSYVTCIHSIKNQLAYLELLTERLTFMFGYYNYYSIPFLLHSKWEDRINELNRL